MFFKRGQIYILSSLCYEATVLGEGRLEMRVETHRMWFNAGRLTLGCIRVILRTVSSSPVQGPLFFPKSYVKEVLWLFIVSAYLT